MKNIIITGGELFNKGAQSMLFIAIDNIKKRFPNHQVLVMSPMNAARPLSERKSGFLEIPAERKNEDVVQLLLRPHLLRQAVSAVKEAVCRIYRCAASLHLAVRTGS